LHGGRKTEVERLEGARIESQDLRDGLLHEYAAARSSPELLLHLPEFPPHLLQSRLAPADLRIESRLSLEELLGATSQF
jgi:hypothetical protein